MAGLLLAAGASMRLGQPKALLRAPSGAPLVAEMTERLLAGGCDEVLVVLGAQAESVLEALAPVQAVHPSRLHTLRHDKWADGMGSSIAAGIRALRETTGDGRVLYAAALLATCDMPAVTAAHVAALDRRWRGDLRQRVASRWQDDNGEEIIGVPAILPIGDWSTLAELRGDQGARALLRAPGTRRVDLPGGALDLDTPADVARWQADWPGAERGP
ncbi:nucleotidyltransferase family protein [Gemmatimonas sp. UBA7669]|uniref:nucleotidyltransferase family protein n=1 Tax=Gemmatimonas sp. UBA7669 TaxID=1946568 RepID=UPI0025BF4774|nr:nucleotidyltransferase family protein [Gemmatimonas sp. UBA7669]